MIRQRRWLARGLALTDALVMLAVIALMFSILLPALGKIRESARRSMCADNMHHLMMAVLSYANDHDGIGPTRGWKTYTVAEVMREIYGTGGNVRAFCNLGLLYKKWIGGQHDMLYCPSLYQWRDNASYGWPSVSIPVPQGYWSFGGYDYGVILRQRSGALSSPDFSGSNPFPAETWSTNMVDWVAQWEANHPGVQFEVPNNPAIAYDWTIGGKNHVHGVGINVMYADGHVRLHDTRGLPSMACDRWYKVSLKQ